MRLEGRFPARTRIVMTTLRNLWLSRIRISSAMSDTLVACGVHAGTTDITSGLYLIRLYFDIFHPSGEATSLLLVVSSKIL